MHTCIVTDIARQRAKRQLTTAFPLARRLPCCMQVLMLAVLAAWVLATALLLVPPVPFALRMALHTWIPAFALAAVCAAILAPSISFPWFRRKQRSLLLAPMRIRVRRRVPPARMHALLARSAKRLVSSVQSACRTTLQVLITISAQAAVHAQVLVPRVPSTRYCLQIFPRVSIPVTSSSKA